MDVFQKVLISVAVRPLIGQNNRHARSRDPGGAQQPVKPQLAPTEQPGRSAEELRDSRPEVPLGQQPTRPQEDPPGAPHAQQVTETGNDAQGLSCPALQGRIGSYELLQELARGGQGIVYKARHTTLGRLTALKTMRADSSTPREQAQRFDREMRAAARLNHPHIVPIFEVGKDQNRPYYAMEYLSGGSLADHLPRFQANRDQVITLMIQVARAVAHAHAQGILHRDLKPGNILLDAESHPHVSDFGLARFLDGGEDLTQTGTVMGTPAYMAPEQARGQTSEFGPATDVWALGVMLFELLTGQRPFTADSGEAVRTLVLKEAPPRPTTLRPDLSPALESIVLKCLEKKPQQRYPSATSLAADLERYQQGLPITGGPSRWYRRRAFLAAAALFGVTGVTAGTLFHSEGTDPTKDTPKKQSEEIVLIPAVGPPRHLRLLFADKKFQSLGEPEKHFFCEAEGICLQELRPAAGFRHYTLSAEILLGKGTAEKSAGLYFAGARYPVPAGPGAYQTYWGVSFNERLRPAEGIHRRVGVARLGEQPPHPRHVAKVALKTPILKLADGGQYRQWRRLLIAVDPERTQIFWENELLMAVSTLEAETRTANALDGTGIQATFTPQGGMGLFVFEGEAWFRNVVLSHPIEDR